MAHGTNDQGADTAHGTAEPDQGTSAKPVRVPGVNVWHLGTQVREWTEAALRRAAGREPFWYDVNLTALPHNAVVGPNGIGFEIMTAYVLTVFAPNALIGKRPYAVAKIITNDFPSQEDVKQVVRECVEEIRTQRAQHLQLPPGVNPRSIN